MKKKVAILLAATAVIILACLCLPTNSIPHLIGISTLVPTEPTVLPTATDTLPEAVPLCVLDLTNLLSSSQSMKGNGNRLRPDGEYTLVTYQVSGDMLSDPVYADVPDSLKSYQQDTTAQQKIWDFITAVIPVDQRTMVTEFMLYTDGVDGSLGAVEQMDTPNNWIFELDMADAANFADLSTTVIHEFAHLLTLNSSQVTTDMLVFDNPDDRFIYDSEAATCPTYFSYEGCSRADSYIYTFFNSFWTSIYGEWTAIDSEMDPNRRDQQLHRFYRKYADQFVSEYAATSPSEDLAESFMYYIFTLKPSSDTLSAQKIRFFYQFPEMVTLHDGLIEKLCTYVEKP
jgi:hypothetical protein